MTNLLVTVSVDVVQRAARPPLATRLNFARQTQCTALVQKI